MIVLSENTVKADGKIRPNCAGNFDLSLPLQLIAFVKSRTSRVTIYIPFKVKIKTTLVLNVDVGYVDDRFKGIKGKQLYNGKR